MPLPSARTRSTALPFPLRLLPLYLLQLCLFALCLNAAAPSPRYTVYLFLLEDCKISQAYTSELGAIYADYAGPNLDFVGLFPNPVSTDSAVQEFSQTYHLPFACSRKGAAEYATQFNVSVTPEAVVYDHSADSVVYQGRIDDLFVRVGQRRQVVTTHDLRNALEHLRNGTLITVPRTTAVGCILNLGE